MPLSSQPRIIRMAHPLAFAAYLRHHGERADGLLETESLPVAGESDDAFVPLQRAWGFFDSTAQKLDQNIAWRVGLFTGEQKLQQGLLNRLSSAPTLLSALQTLIRLISAEASHLQLGLQERRDDVLFYTHYPDMKNFRGYHCSQAYQLGVYVTIVRHYAGMDWSPTEIGIEYPVVPSVTKELFPGTRVRPRRLFGYVAIPRTLLHLAPPAPAEGDTADGEFLLLTDQLDYPDTLRALLVPHLPDGYPDASLAAALMDTSVRTLARRLAESGLTYRKVVDELRFTEARKLLPNSRHSIIDVAAAVGFDDPSHFARMFRRIGGISPREFRRSELRD